MAKANSALPVRLYRRALRLYPAGYRERFGPEMVQMFRQQWQELGGNVTGWQQFRLILRTLTDLLITSFQQRLTTLTSFRSMKRSLPSSWRLNCSLIAGLLIAALVFGATAIVNVALPKTYLSTVRVRLFDDIRPSTPAQSTQFIQAELEVMRSQAVLSAAIDRTDLETAWSETHPRRGMFQPAEVIEILRDKLEVSPYRDTCMVEIRVHEQDRELAAAIANAIADSYVAYRVAGAAAPGLRPTIIDRAEPGLRPIRPNIPLNLVMGLPAAGGLGLVSGLVIWFLLGRSSRPLPTPMAAGA